MCQQYHVTTEKIGTEYLFGKIGQGGLIQYEGEIHYQFEWVISSDNYTRYPTP